ncbi:MAG: restriction endonuclease subunit S [Candidatus Heimdallarchaeaceae archaeon]
MKIPIVPLGEVAAVSWGNTSITKASYVDSGCVAFSASGPDGFLPVAEHHGEGVVLSAIGARCGKCFFANGDWTAIKNTITITPNGLERSDIRYLFHFLNREGVWPSRGGGQPFIGLGTAREVMVPLPPLPEQKRIAAILDKADAIRKKRKKAIELTETFLRSAFLEMFGDPVTNPKGWKRVRCGDLCNRITVGIVVKPASHYVEEGVPALRSLNIRPGKIKLDDLVHFSHRDNEGKLSKTRVRSGDIVLVRSGQPGTCAVIPDDLDGINSIDILIGTPKHDVVRSVFLCAFFNSEGGKKLVLENQKGQIQKHLNVGSLKTAKIPLPPLSMQKDFESLVEKAQVARSTHLSGDKQNDQLFLSLTQRAFRGEL